MEMRWETVRWDELGPERLARLLEVEAAGWTGEDAGAILRAQLAAPLVPDLLMVPGVEADRLRGLIRGRPGAGSFMEQLTFLYPSLELLESIKTFARQVREDAASPVGGGPADVLYFAAIAAALLRCKMRISKLTDAELREGFSWALRQPGAEGLGLTLREALVVLAV